MTAPSYPSRLPPEIWRMVFQWVLTFPPELEDGTVDFTVYASSIRDTLANALLACSMFRAIAQPLLFHDMSMSCIHGFGFEPDDAIRYLDRFRQVLAERSVVKNWVRSLDIRVHPIEFAQDGHAVEAIRKIHSLTESVLLQLGQLQDLRLEGVPISEATFRHVNGLQGLQRLTLYGCNLEDAVMEEIRRTGNPLKYLFARSTWQDEPLNPKFAILSLGGNITSLDVDMRILLPYIEEAARLSSWEKVVYLGLKVTEEDMVGDLLEKVLLSFPSATALLVTEDYQRGSIILPPRVASGCLPRLAAVEVPWKFLGTLLPGRPIESVVVSLSGTRGSFDCMRDFLILKQTTVELEELDLDGVYAIQDLFKAIAIYTPNLKHLTVGLYTCYDYLTLLKAFTSAENVMPNLRHLCCTSPRRPNPAVWAILTAPIDGEDTTGDGATAPVEPAEEGSDQYSEKFDDAVMDWLAVSGSILPSLKLVEFEQRLWHRPSTSEEWIKPTTPNVHGRDSYRL